LRRICRSLCTIKLRSGGQPLRIGIAAAVLALALAPSAPAQEKPKPQILANVLYGESLAPTFSADGRQFLVGNSLGTVRLWDVASGRLIRSFVPKRPDDRQYVTGIGTSAKADLVVSNDRYGTISIWRASTGQLLRTLENRDDDAQRAFAFTSDGKRVVSANRNEIKVWDTATWRITRTHKLGAIGDEKGREVAFSPDAAYALIHETDLRSTGQGPPQGPLQPPLLASLVEVQTGRALWSLQGDAAAIGAAAFSPDGASVAASYPTIPGGGATAGKHAIRLIEAKTGKQLRAFDGHTADISSLSFSQDGARMVSVGVDGSLKIWEVRSGRELQEATVPVSRKADDNSTELLLAPGGAHLATWDENEYWSIWETQTGRMVGKLGTPLGAVRLISMVPRSQVLRAANFIDSAGAINSWDLQTGRLVGTVPVQAASGFHSGYSTKIAFSPDGALAVTGSGNDETDEKNPSGSNPLTIWDVASGTVVRTLAGHPKQTAALAFSPDGQSILSAGGDGSATLWNVADGRVRWTTQFPTSADLPDGGAYECAAFSLNGDRVLLGGNDGVRLFDAKTGNLIRFYAQPDAYGISAVAFSPDGRRMIASNGDWDNNAAIFDVQTGARLRTLKGHSKLVFSVAYSPDGSKVLTGGYDGTARIWNAATGAQLNLLRLDSASGVRNVQFSSDGTRAFTGHLDGSIAIWSTATGARIATLIAGQDGEWVVITAEGFFDASPKGSQLIHVVAGVDVVTIGQFFQQLYRPDLVREKLAGDPQGKVRAAAAALDLTKVLASGAVPQVRIVSPVEGTPATQDQVTVQVEVNDRGGGIGRVEWRVNSVTLGLEEPVRSPAVGGLLRLQRTLQLDEGDNQIEVVVHNAKDLIASEPARTIIRWDGTGSRTAPRLYVLAIGVNEYSDGRLRLSFAAPDAKAFASALKLASRDLFQTIEVVTALDGEVTRDRLNAVITTLGNEIKPSDVFVFFIAGHGRTIDGRYYFLPEDFLFRDEASIRSNAISQDQLQAWFAKIPAKKSVLIFDTCGSGSLTQELFATRSDEYLVAVDRLTHAIGRTVLSASTAYQQAIEGYHDHGLFTYALLEGLSRASANDDGLITVLGLHDYVMLRVPQLSSQVFGRRQEPMAGFRGASFPLVKPTDVLGDSQRPAALTISSIPTHVTIRATEVYATPAVDAAALRSLQPGTLVTLILTDKDWTLVAKDGKQLGYVSTNSLVRIQ
jgi:WD40 repeat protein